MQGAHLPYRHIALQLGAVVGPPILLVTYLITLRVIPATLALAIVMEAGLAVLASIG